MKKSLLSLAAIAFSSLGAFAQGYYYFKTTGEPEGYSFTPPTTATAAITGNSSSQSNVLSAAQNMPFNWSLFGLNVSQFKVSSSGYLTFDVSQTTDNQTNEVLPSATAPKMAIFAFWDKTRIQTITSGSTTYASDVKYYTYGTAPKQTLAIQWRLIQTDDGTNATNVTYYAILIHEDGGFDIVQNYGFGTFTATTGVQNFDGTVGTMVTGGPNMNFGGNSGSYVAASTTVYNFRYGTQPATDLVIKKNATAGVVSLNSSGAQIKVDVANYGSNNVTSATMNYTVAGGATVSAPATLSVTSNGGTGTVAHATAYMPVTADAGTNKSVKVWFTGVNGSDLSDSITFDLFVNKGISGDKRVLVEEGSGAWCGYCPDGHYRLKTILDENPGKVVAVVHHNADGMTNTESNTINSTFALGYPYGTVDRAKYDDQDEVGMNRGDWAAKVTEQLAKPTPVNISIVNKNFDWATGTVTYTVKVDFVDFAKPGDLRINTMIVEDKVRGPQIAATSTTWNQRNYYSFEAGNQAGGASHPLFTEPAYITGYWHNEVVRAIPSGAWGTSGVITNPSENMSFTKDFTYTMSKANSVTYTNNTDEDTEYRSTKNGRGWNKFEDTKIIAFVSYYDADVNKREVLNATQTTMINTGVNELAENNIGGVSVYPNPTNGISTVDFTLTNASNVTIEVVNVLGQKVALVANANYKAGENSVSFDAAKLNTGIYFINITSVDGKATYRFVVTK